MKHIRRTRATAFVLVVAILMSLGLPIGVYGADPLCGSEEHTHTEDCYIIPGELAYSCTDASIGIHHHEDGCYDEEGNAVCGYSDFVIHAHDVLCYDENGTLVCTLEEHELHQHDDSCYTEEEVLICSEEEDLGHQHGDGCYEESDVLVCKLEESDGHTHTEECFADCMEDHEHSAACASCGQEETEGHQHTDSCYETKNLLNCGQEEREPGHIHADSCYQTESVLSCGLKEASLHSHTAECFDSGVYESGSLICGQTELFEHQHTDACTYLTDPTNSDTPVCGLEEHSHTDACYESEKTCVEVSLTIHSVDAAGTTIVEDSVKTVEITVGEEALLADLVDATVVTSDCTYSLFEVLDMDPASASGSAISSINADAESYEVWAVYEEQESGGWFDAEVLPDISVTGDEILVNGVSFSQGAFANGLSAISIASITMDGGIYDLLSSPMEDGLSGAAKLYLLLEYQSAHLQAFGALSKVVFSGISLEQPLTGFIKNSSRTPVGYYYVSTDGVVYVLLSEEGLSASVLSLTLYKDIVIEDSADVEMKGVEYEEGDGVFVLTKVASEDGSPLFGAEFALYADADCTMLLQSGTQVVSDSVGETNLTVFNGLAPGTYYFKEVKAPFGYSIDKQVYTLTVAEDSSMEVSPELPAADLVSGVSEDAIETVGDYDLMVAVVNGRPVSELYISVVDKVSNEIIPGFRFTSYSDSSLTNGVEGEVMDDGSSYFGTWLIGTSRYIKETTTPDGYTPDETVYEVISMGDNEFTCEPEGLIATTSTHEATSSKVTSVGELYSTRQRSIYDEVTVDKTVAAHKDAADSEYSDAIIAEEEYAYFKFDAFIPAPLVDAYPSLYVEFDDVSTGVLYGYMKNRVMTINDVDVGSFNSWNADGKWNHKFGITLSDYLTNNSIDYEDGVHIVLTYYLPISYYYVDTVVGAKDTNTINLNLKESQTGSLLTTVSDTVDVYAPFLQVAKVDENGDALTSSKISISRWDEETGEYDYIANNSYKPIPWQTFLSSGQYKVYEAQAPAGYFLEDPFEFSVSYSLEDGELVPTITSVSGENCPVWDAENGYLTVTMVDVSGAPKLSKEVYNRESEEWTSYLWMGAEAETFRMTGTLPTNLESYESFQYKFHDAIDKALGELYFVPDSLSVTIGGQAISSSNYTLNTSCEDGCVFEVDLGDIAGLVKDLGIDVSTDNTVVVTYQMTCEDPEAQTVSEYSVMPLGGTSYSAENQGWVEFTGGKTSVSTVSIDNLGFFIYKVDGNGNALTGASFKLQKWNEEDSVWEEFDSPLKTTDGSTFFTYAVEYDVKYRIIETVAPDGYLPMEPVEFKLYSWMDGLTRMVTYDADGNEEFYKWGYSYQAVNEPNMPKVTKEVYDSVTDSWTDNIYLKMGYTTSSHETLQYRLTINVPQTVLDEYETMPSFTVYDTMEGVLYNPKTPTVTINGTQLSSSYYTYSKVDTRNTQIVFKDIHATLTALGITATDGVDIIVTYYGSASTTTSNLAAVAGNADHNQTYVEFNGITGEPSEIAVHVINLVVNKVDDEGEPLSGATFKLYKWDGEDYDSTFSSSKSDSDGYASLTRLIPGRYLLKETTIPDGYAASNTRVEFDLDFELNDDGTIDVTTTAVDGAVAPVWDEENEQLTITVENKSLLITATKEVLNNESGEWDHLGGTYASYEKIPYRIIGTLPEGLDNMESFSYRFHDQGNNPLVLDETSLSLTIAGEVVDKAEYSLIQDCACGCTFAVDIPDIKAVVDRIGLTVDASTEVILNYNMLLAPTFVQEEETELSLTASGIMPLGGGIQPLMGPFNYGWIEYEGVLTPSSSTCIDTTSLVLYKYDDYGNLLSGASFILQEWDGSQYVTVVSDPIVSEDGCSFNFGKIKIETSYRLVETVTPEGGYEAADPIEFRVDLSAYGEPVFTLINNSVGNTKVEADDGDYLYEGKVYLTNSLPFPSVKKEVLETNDDLPGVGVWTDKASHDVGDTVQYRITGTLPADISRYSSYYYEIIDTSNVDLLVDFDKIVVTVDGSLVASDAYTLVREDESNKFFIKFDDILSVLKDMNITPSKNTQIRVSYQAVLNECSYYYRNSVSLSHTHGDGVYTQDGNSAYVYAAFIYVTKVDYAGTKLTGANFTLQKWNGSEYEDYQTAEVQSSGYEFHFKGLDEGRYKLIETVVPEGYAGAEDLEFEISNLIDYDVATFSVISGPEGFTSADFCQSGQSIFFNVVNGSDGQLPVIQKEVLSDDGFHDPTWQRWATYDVGDSVSYRLTGTLPNDLSDFSSYKYIFHDAEDTALQFDPTSVKVTIGGEDVAPSFYEVSTECSDGCTFELSFEDIKAVITELGITVSSDTKVVVTYTNIPDETDTPVYDRTGEKNIAFLEYSSSLDTPDETESTQTVSATIYTIALTLYKKNEAGSSLGGANFTLQKWNKTEYVDFIVLDEPSSDVTVFDFKGLGAGRYKLVETKVPDGYVGRDLEFIISVPNLDSRGHLNAEIELLNLGEDTLSYAEEYYYYWGFSTVVFVNYPYEINVFVPQLPDTGSTGSLPIYLSSMILLAAGALLLWKKRRATEQ